MLTVHHLGLSQSERIVWLCEELGIGYEMIRYDRDPETRLAPAAYKALHPLGTAPIITDGALALAESGAIIDYIIGKYGDGRLQVTADAPNYADYLFWYHFANGSLMPALMFVMVLNMMGDMVGDAPIAAVMRARADNAFALLEQRLGELDYLAGPDLTAADIITGFPLTTGRLFADFSIEAYPNIRAYLQRIGARPAYQRAMAKAEPSMTPHLT